MKTKSKLAEYNPNGRRINYEQKYKDVVDANIKSLLLSSRYKSSKAINKFYSEDIKYLEDLLKQKMYQTATKAKLVLDPQIVAQVSRYSVQDLVAGKYDNLNETDGQDLAIKQKETRAKQDLAKAKADKANKKAKDAEEKLKKLTQWSTM